MVLTSVLYLNFKPHGSLIYQTQSGSLCPFKGPTKKTLPVKRNSLLQKIVQSNYAQLICQVPQSLFHAFQNAYVQIRHSFRMPSINPKDLQIFSLHVSNYFCSMLYIHSKKNYCTYIFPVLRSDILSKT